MNKRQKLIVGAIVLLAVAFISGVSIMAATNFGSQSDPLVTLSYLTDKFKPQVITELQTDITRTANELTAEFDMKIALLESEIGSGGTSQQPGKSDVFSVVTLSKGQTVKCSVGTEIMLRIGSATGSGSAPALVNATDGTTLSSGAALVTNHMYLVTIEGNSVKAEADTVKILIRGSYTVS